MNTIPIALGCTLVAAVLAGCGGSSGDGSPPAVPLEISVLGNRADLISGGQALVEVKMKAKRYSFQA